MNGNTEDGWPLTITGDFLVANRRLDEWAESDDEELREMIRACRFPWDLLAIQERVMSGWEEKISGEVHPAAVIEGHLQLGKGSRILPGVFIEGNVVIGEGCKIGPNCYVRGATAIGDNCIIGQSVEVKNSIILSGTSIGHLSYVGDSILGEKVNFGAGTIVSNFRHDGRNHLSAVNGEQMDTGRLKFGTVVGDGVHTGIGTLIYPGRKIGAGMFTLPGDIVRRDLRP
jgi:bifunctional UDP-N-acetylglucosamine pyrophosphorylase/glucosamine-1-phosphate N-acetyltransferase